MAGVKPLLETIGALLPKGIKAWHASPHDFDKFDMSKIGTGQGAQSYGHGIYAAESPAVSGVGGEYWKEFGRGMINQERGPRKYALDVLVDNHGDKNKAIEFLNYKIEQKPGSLDAKSARDALYVLQNEQVGPRIYELNIKARPDEMLNWDAPIEKQSPFVQSVADRLGIAPTNQVGGFNTGGDLYTDLALQFPRRIQQQEASRALLSEGIPGIRYFDAGSRGLPSETEIMRNRIAQLEREGLANSPQYRTISDRLRALEAMPVTSNYVLFNPDIIEIMRKLAIPGMVGGGAAASVYQPQGSN